VDGLNDIKKIMAFLRDNPPPAAIAGSKIIEARDYKKQLIVNVATGASEASNLPISDVLYLAMEDGSWTCIRPSGTEPKIKLYFGAKLSANATEADASEKLKAMIADFKAIIDIVN
jgi:phosphoglucomutase